MKNKILELLRCTESYFVYFLEKLARFVAFISILTLFILLNIYDIDVILEGVSSVLTLVYILVYIFLVK